MLITICNLSYYNLYHIIMCFVKINHQSIKQKKEAKTKTKPSEKAKPSKKESQFNSIFILN